MPFELHLVLQIVESYDFAAGYSTDDTNVETHSLKTATLLSRVVFNMTVFRFVNWWK